MGWYDNESLEGEEYDFAKPISSNLTLYALWGHNITFIDFDDSTFKSINLKLDEVTSKPNNPSREDATFCGWYLDIETLVRNSSLPGQVVLDPFMGGGSTAVACVFHGGEVYIPLGDLIDIDKEIERLNKEKENLQKELDRVAGKLSNEAFVSKAPEKVINAEKEKQAKYLEMYNGVEERIAMLSKEL